MAAGSIEQLLKMSSVKQREINVTDEQIDALVYELYRLTKEEIRIVEGKPSPSPLRPTVPPLRP